MISFWRFIQRWRWHEGPRAGDVLDFARSEPEGRMLRYQMKQRGSLLDRWAKHVEGWVEAAEGRDRLVVIRYDKLRDRIAIRFQVSAIYWDSAPAMCFRGTGPPTSFRAFPPTGSKRPTPTRCANSRSPKSATRCVGSNTLEELEIYGRGWWARQGLNL